MVNHFRCARVEDWRLRQQASHAQHVFTWHIESLGQSYASFKAWLLLIAQHK